MKARISNPVASPVLVTGGTGTLGRLVVARLRDAGCDVRVLSRRSREGGQGIEEDREGIEFVTGDLATGEGIDAAVEGTEIIVHCAGTPKGDEDKARHLSGCQARPHARSGLARTWPRTGLWAAGPGRTSWPRG